MRGLYTGLHVACSGPARAARRAGGAPGASIETDFLGHMCAPAARVHTVAKWVGRAHRRMRPGAGMYRECARQRACLQAAAGLGDGGGPRWDFERGCVASREGGRAWCGDEGAVHADEGRRAR